jgi:hypothetical protein
MLLGSENVELHNRIYEYASEDLDDLRYAPRVMQRLRALRIWQKRIWKFIGLANTCKQIRAEYRPLWLRNRNKRLQIEKLQALARVFSRTNMPSFAMKIEPVSRGLERRGV